MIPLVLKKHSPLLYTEKHGTVALRKDSRARSILAVFAISENRRSAKVKETPWTHQSDSGSSTQYSGWCSHSGWSFQHCVWKCSAAVLSLRSPLCVLLLSSTLFLLLPPSPPQCPSWTDALSPPGLSLFILQQHVPPNPPFFYQNTLTFYFLCCHLSTNLPIINYQRMFTRTYTPHTQKCTHNKHICCSVCHSPLHCFADSAPEYTVCTLSDNICFTGCHLTLSVDRADDTLYRTTRLWPIV